MKRVALSRWGRKRPQTLGSFGALAVVLLALPACVSDAPKTTSLRMKGGDLDASVTVDEKYLGTLAYVGRRGVALPPGKHRITVEKAGFFPWDKLVEAHEGDAPIMLDVALVKIPD